MALRGTAEFTYGAGPTTYAMEWPLQNPRPAISRTRYESWSLDKTEREVLVVGDGAAEIEAEIRFEDAPEDLLAMLDEAANGTEITYYQSSGGTAYPCQLISPTGDQIGIIRDRVLGIRGRYEVTVRLRRTDSGNFDALL